MDILQNYIDGAWVKSKETNTIEVINPATQEVLGKVPNGTNTGLDVAKAVEAASEAYKSWRQNRIRTSSRMKMTRAICKIMWSAGDQ